MIAISNKIFVLTLCCLAVFATDAVAFDDDVTHPNMTSRAIKASALPDYVVSNLGISEGIYRTVTMTSSYQNPLDPNNQMSVTKTQTIIEWLLAGSIEEDSPMCRATNHFHNPLKTWSISQMSDDTYSRALIARNVCNSTGWSADQRKSNVVWATGLNENGTPASIQENTTASPSSPNTWQKARGYFYKALTEQLDIDRQTNLAKTFQAVGQVLHLLEDMAVPAHVRNDFQSHTVFTGAQISFITAWFNNRFEKYVKDKDTTIMLNASISHPEFVGTQKLTDFWDTLRYRNSYNAGAPNPTLTLSNAGLAEYTNANFVSDSTIFADNDLLHKFPYPSLATSVTTTSLLTTDQLSGIQKKREYYWKAADGESGYLLAGKSFFKFEADRISAVNPNETIHITKWIPPMDDKVHADYAARLIPRAIGYSAALLDYFFRGTLEISAPSTHVYAIADGSSIPYTDDVNGNHHQQFTKIKAKVKNTTKNETIEAGTLRAVAKYKIIPNYDPYLSNYPPDGAVMTGGTTTNPGVQYSYSVSEEVDCASLASGASQDFTFPFTNNPIPAGITDLTLQVVFKGTIGNEQNNAIAVGMMDLMEPTHLVFWNLSDRFSLQYPDDKHHLYTFDPQLMDFQNNGNQTVVSMLDTNNNNDLSDEDWIKPQTFTYKIAFSNTAPQELLSPLATAEVLAGRHSRLIVLIDVNSWYTYVQLSWPNVSEPSGPDEWLADYFEGVWNQSWNSTFQVLTPIKSFRFALAEDGQTHVPIKQHYYVGILSCYPGALDSAGNEYCPYEESESPAVDLTPVTATINFE